MRQNFIKNLYLALHKMLDMCWIIHHYGHVYNGNIVIHDSSLSAIIVFIV